MIDLLNSYDFFVSNDLTQIVNFPTRIPDSALLDLFLSSDASMSSTMAFPTFGNSDYVLSQFPWTFDHIHNGMPCFIALLMTILVLIGTVFVIICEMFLGRMSLNSVLLLLLVNFLSGFLLEFMCISLIESIR